MYELNDFNSIQIGIASPEQIKAWSYGEVTKPETINYRTQKPEKDGLFCEKIFGPTKDYECHCGKYKRIRYKGRICEKCGVEVTKSKVRRERMGHIELAAPVTHIWYFRGVPSRIGLLLDMSPKALEQVVYFAAYVVLDPGFNCEFKIMECGGKQCILGYRPIKEVKLVKELDEAVAEVNKLSEGMVDPNLLAVGEKTCQYFYELNKEPLEGDEEFKYIIKVKEIKNLKAFDSLDEANEFLPKAAELSLSYKKVITEKVRSDFMTLWDDFDFRLTEAKTGMGAESIRELLMAVDLDREYREIKHIITSNTTGQKRIKAIKRVEIVDSFRRNNSRPEWMVLTYLPVIPPDIRPMVQLDGGRFASSDLNDLYRRVINRNNRLKRMIELGAPDMIVKNEKRMLQEAVDALIDNGKRGRPISGASNRELKSLSAMLRGKQGRFRQNLLGKRVDYSGRSVIVVGPELKIYQCGLPKEMAIELYKPFVMKRLCETGVCHNIKSAKRTVEKAKPIVWDVLEEVIKDHPVLLNRAPTLHRLSIQAFEPVLIEGRAIKISPLVCGPFNADFDGDQMAVHLPISIEAQAEARFLMLSANNILKLADGKSVMSPTQDMIIGAYTLTIIRRKEGEKYDYAGRPDENGEVYIPPVYSSFNEAVMAYQTQLQHVEDEIYVRRVVDLPDGKFNEEYTSLPCRVELPPHKDGEQLVKDAVVVRKPNTENGLQVIGIIKTSVGRIIYNDEMPQDLNFVKRNTPADYLKLELSDEFIGSARAIGKKHLSRIVEACFKTGGAPRASMVLDMIKERGYKYSTLAALTTSVFDMKVPEEKSEIVKSAEDTVAKIAKKYSRGLLKEEERYRAVIDVWDQATDQVAGLLKKQGEEDKFNPIWMMADSGARGSIDQIKQLSGMRGLMVNPQGKKIEVPVKSCFRNGLNVLEYFISSHGGRKGLADTALKTADSGYMTRRLVDVAQEVIIREEDCCVGKKPRGITVSTIYDEAGRVIETLEERLRGRFASAAVVNPATGEVIVAENEFITEDKAKEICAAGIEKVAIRSVFTCSSRNGVCAKCYGKDMATTKPVKIGEAVGVIAAQSIGEPGTQLTMRTFHTGGIAATGDITQGLPRVEELFEARKPKGVATLCEVDGVIAINNDDGMNHIIVKDSATGEVKKVYDLPFNAELKVKDGDVVEPGTQLSVGSVNPQDILRISGVKGVQDYILEQVQSVYRGQGVDINDKHVEIIIRQMIRKVRIEDAGTTEMLPGELVDMFTFEEQNEKAIMNEGTPATAKRVLLGITKASLATESFLSAASFQETARVLTDAAIRNKKDYLIGLKENVIIGKLIPAGTGIKDYKNLTPQFSKGYSALDDDDNNTTIEESLNEGERQNA